MKKRSISWWLRAVWAISIAIVCVVMLIADLAARHRLVEQKIMQMSDSFQIYVTEMDNNLEAIHNYLYMEFSNSEAITRIQSGGTKNQLAFARMDISNRLMKMRGWIDYIDSLVFYSPTGNLADLIEVGFSHDYQNRDEIKHILAEHIDQEIEEHRINGKRYLTLEVNGEYYLIRFYQVQHSYVGIVVRVSNVLSSLTQALSEEGLGIYIADAEGRILGTSGEHLSEITEDCTKSNVFVSFNREKYLQIAIPTETGDFFVGTWINDHEIYRGINIVRYILFLVILIFLIAVLAGQILLERVLSQPLKKVSQGMGLVGKGNMDIHMPEDGIVIEYADIASSFNQMVDEIQSLKIREYENKLEVQKANLQYLQLQINPHFFLNALNIIYSMAEVGDHQMIQKMTISLVKYLRYMFQDATTLVTLQEEVAHVRAYIDIQQIRFCNAIQYLEELDGETLDALVPPFVIQSFIENSIKYALQNHRDNIIEITSAIETVNDKKTLCLTIWDNGQGYSEEKLAELNEGRMNQTDSQHNIGLKNVRDRLNIIYGGRASMKFENLEGAYITIKIPFISVAGTNPQLR